MTRALIVHSAGPAVTIQDQGRPGYLSFGLSQGGAADRRALFEGAALLGQAPDCAAVEMAGMGGVFEATQDMRIALTGAPMRTTLDDKPLVWNASHWLPKGARLSIGAAQTGVYGYLHLGGGLDTPCQMGSRSAHLAAGLGTLLCAGVEVPVGPDTGTQTGMAFPAPDRFSGGAVRIVASLQTEIFDPQTLARFEATTFHRDTRGNRMGVRLIQDGDGFQSDAGLTVLSEIIVPGDIQITGDGRPFVLLSECQTTGGYPRIGSVVPVDLPRVAQAAAGTALRFSFIGLDDAAKVARSEEAARQSFRQDLFPLVRDPRNIPDLLAYQLIGGVTAGHDVA